VTSRDTDGDWEEIGRLNPYFGVLTDPKFKTENLTEATRAEFFQSGRDTVSGQLALLQHRYPDFAPASALDFGCGVGRLTRALGEVTGDAVGIDVSEAMLAEARRQAPPTVAFMRDLPDRSFDWLMSLIVFQHIPPERGYDLLTALIARLAPGGCVTLQFVIYRDERLARVAGGRIVVGETGVAAATGNAALARLARGEMFMFDYDLSVIAAILFAGGLEAVDLEHSDHGGFHGVIVRGRKPA
jgi:SAM-dependent methyltransferase